MTDATTVLLASIVGPCPTCRNGRLQPVFDGEGTNFLCATCGSCWHAELGWVRRVSPLTCPGCASHGTCLATPLPQAEPFATVASLSRGASTQPGHNAT